MVPCKIIFLNSPKRCAIKYRQEAIYVKFNDDQKAHLATLGVPRQMVEYWEKGGGIGKKYAPAVAKVLRKPVEEVLYPADTNGKAESA
jgi:hypothetical protein